MSCFIVYHWIYLKRKPIFFDKHCRTEFKISTFLRDDMLYIIVTKRDGAYQTGYNLFTSQTNTVNVRFTSDNRDRRSGFRLDVRSTSCDSVDSTVKKVTVATGEVLEDTLVSVNYPNSYPNNAWQQWNIITDENQVWFQNKHTFTIFYETKPHMLYFIV